MNGAGKPIRLLLVDDAEAIRELFRLALSFDPRFAVVGEAGDGVEAIDKAKELKPDVILLDIAMPRLDGLQAIPKLHEAARGTRIIVFTGFENDAMARQAIELCASAVFSKGFPITQLTERIGQMGTEPPKEVCLQSA